MANVTINGNSYSDDGTAGRDMRNGGHRQWLLPMLGDLMVETRKVAEVVAGGLSKITVGVGGLADATAAGLYVRGSANDGTQGITVDNYAPTLALVDRSGASRSYRWKVDGGYLRMEVDNLDAGASWQAYQLAVGAVGNMVLGEGSGQSDTQLSVRGSRLTGTTQYGVYNRQTYTPEAAISIRGFQSSPTIGDGATAFTCANVYNFHSGSPVMTAGAAVAAWRHYQADNVASAAVDTAIAFSAGMNVGTNRWNFYASGTAPNYLAGSLLLGTTVDNGTDKLQVNGAAVVTGRLTVGAGLSGSGPLLTTGFSGAAFTVGSTSVAHLQIGGTANTAAINVSRWSADASGAVINLGKSRAATVGSTGAAVVSGDALGGVNFAGDDGATVKLAASITAIAEEAFTGTAHGTRLVVYTTDIAGTSQREVARWAPSGNLLLGLTADSGDRINVSGSVNVSAGYKVAANQVVGARKTGWSAMTGTAARTAGATHAAQTIAAAYTQSQIQNIDNSVVIVSQRLKALIDDLTTHGLIGA